MKNSIDYSICMANYNMAATLDRAVTSIAAQLDSRFEIVLVDDGSSDDSVAIMHSLAARFPIVRVVPLRRSSDRKLGETRNVSVREARGRYCLLHLDCDDIYAPHLSPWIEVFHQIETAIGSDILLAGQHIHMAKRDRLLANGPYINIFRGEDRNMYTRFGGQGLLWFLDHVDFATRLPKTGKERFQRTVSHTFDHMVTDFRSGTGFFEYLRFERIKANERSVKLVMFRLAVLPLTWLVAKFRPPIRHDQALDGHEVVADYRGEHRGSFAALMARHGAQPDWSRIPEASRFIFDVE